MRQKRLIVGLGNPGQEYEKTRHNLGFRIVTKLAQNNQAKFVKEKSFPGFYAKTVSDLYEIHYLMPLSYMNESGMAMWRCMEYYKVNFQNVLIIADDIALPFGSMRLRPYGSSGGHNGLRSVEEWIGTHRYCRLRVGVGEPQVVALKNYVLENLSEQEEAKWPKIEDHSVELVNQWIQNPGLSTSLVLE